MNDLNSKKVFRSMNCIEDEWLEEAFEPMERQKNRITRLKRVGQIVGGLAAAFALTVGICALDPALAANIPFVGDIFRLVSNKTGYIPINITDYGTVEVLDEKVLGEEVSGAYTLRAVSGYSDGYTVQVGMELIAPAGSEETFAYYEAFAHKNTAAVNGEEAKLRTVSLFTFEEGRWIGAATMEVPPAQQSAGEFSVELNLGMVLGQMKLGGFSGASERSFKLCFTVKADKTHETRFSCEEQDNGAKVLAVLATPSVTRITVEKPYWGDASPAAEDGTLGYPLLFTAGGKEIRLDPASTFTLGGYDRLSKEAQTAELYFDGVPQEEKRLVLRFVGTASSRKDEIFAEFAIDLKNKTVTPAGTPAGEVAVHEKNSIIGTGRGETENGLTLEVIEIMESGGVWQASLSISQEPGYLNGRVQGFAVELYNAGNELLAVSGSSLVGEAGYGEPNSDWSWVWSGEIGDEVLAYLPRLDLTGAAERGLLPREGEAVTVVLRNQFSGDIVLLSDTCVLQ